MKFQPLLLALPLLPPLSACFQRTLPETGSQESGPPDTSDTDTEESGVVDREPYAIHDPGGLECFDDYLDAPADVPPGLEYWGKGDNTDVNIEYRIVELPSEHFEHLYVVVFNSKDQNNQAFAEGMPAMVSSVPSMNSMNQGLSRRIPSYYGFIELQPVYPGWTIDAYTTSGVPDDGGEQSAWALVETLRFAAGRKATVQGHTLGMLVGRPVCNGKTVLQGSSGGAMTASRALYLGRDELPEFVVGFGNHEPPSVGQFLTGDGGWIWMDPDTDVDADEDGFGWDDGRSHQYTYGMCPPDASTCLFPYENLAWTTDKALAEIMPTRYSASPYPDEDGVLYSDNNLNGKLDFNMTGATSDVDGNGAIDPLEDFVYGPQHDEGVPWPGNKYFYSPEILQAVVDRGLIDTAAWPQGMATLEESTEFWATRTHMINVPTIAEAYGPDFRVYIEFRESDHAVALPSRPHVMQLYKAYQSQGLTVRYNGEFDLLACVLGATPDFWTGELPVNAEIEEGQLFNYALPLAVEHDIARVLGGLWIFWDVFGEFHSSCLPIPEE